MEIQMSGGSLNLEILTGGGLKQFWKSRWKGGSKNCAFRHGGVDFFWNNPLSLLSPHALFFFSTSYAFLLFVVIKRKPGTLSYFA